MCCSPPICVFLFQERPDWRQQILPHKIKSFTLFWANIFMLVLVQQILPLQFINCRLIFGGIFAGWGGWFPSRCCEVRAFSSRDQRVAACGDHTAPMELLAFPGFCRETSTTPLFTHSHLHVGVLQLLPAFSRSAGTGGSFVTLFFTFWWKYLFSKLIRDGSAIILSTWRKEGRNKPSF